IEFYQILHERICLAVPKTHPLVGRKSVSLKELKEERFVTLERHLFPSHYDKIVSKCEQAGFSPNIVAMSNQTDVLLTYVATGVGIALVAEIIAASWEKDVAFITLEEVSYVDVHLISNQVSETASVKAFRSVFQEYTAEKYKHSNSLD
ncbi:MAG: LysR family substrate-binding domain-containing protein, partial [Kordiimonas sp.]